MEMVSRGCQGRKVNKMTVSPKLSNWAPYIGEKSSLVTATCASFTLLLAKRGSRSSIRCGPFESSLVSSSGERIHRNGQSTFIVTSLSWKYSRSASLKLLEPAL